jgi:hypothetical protein
MSLNEGFEQINFLMERATLRPTFPISHDESPLIFTFRIGDDQ